MFENEAIHQSNPLETKYLSITSLHRELDPCNDQYFIDRESLLQDCDKNCDIKKKSMIGLIFSLLVVVVICTCYYFKLSLFRTEWNDQLIGSSDSYTFLEKKNDWLAINVSLILSAQAYCHVPELYPNLDDDADKYYYDDDNHKSYLTMPYKSHASGFIPTRVLYDKSTQTNGFIGIMPPITSIFVVFRGSADIENWVENLNYEFKDYHAPGCLGCKVHEGFFSAAMVSHKFNLTFR
jgi:hypothetical protein